MVVDNDDWTSVTTVTTATTTTLMVTTTTTLFYFKALVAVASATKKPEFMYMMFRLCDCHPIGKTNLLIRGSYGITQR